MKRLYTIGHSTREKKDFFKLLESFAITHLVDVRTLPRSRRVPWFNLEQLEIDCRKRGIVYLHLPGLGGLRRPLKESKNIGWRNASFRGFADYMNSSDFFRYLKQLNFFLKRENNVAIMCAEALPWRCHRSLISDAELIRGIEVLHIINTKSAYSHKLTSFAKVLPHTKPKKILYEEDRGRWAA